MFTRFLRFLLLLAVVQLIQSAEDDGFTPKCGLSTVTAKRGARFVFVVDHDVGKEKAQRVQLLYRSMACDLQNNKQVSVQVVHVADGKATPTGWLEANGLRAELNRDVEIVDGTAIGTICSRLSASLTPSTLSFPKFDGINTHVITVADEEDLDRGCDIKKEFQKIAGKSGHAPKELFLDTIVVGKPSQVVPGQRMHINEWKDIPLDLTDIGASSKLEEIPQMVKYGSVIQQYAKVIGTILGDEQESNDVVSTPKVERDVPVQTTTIREHSTDRNTTVQVTAGSTGTSASGIETSATTPTIKNVRVEVPPVEEDVIKYSSNTEGPPKVVMDDANSTTEAPKPSPTVSVGSFVPETSTLSPGLQTISSDKAGLQSTSTDKAGLQTTSTDMAQMPIEPMMAVAVQMDIKPLNSENETYSNPETSAESNGSVNRPVDGPPVAEFMPTNEVTTETALQEISNFEIWPWIIIGIIILLALLAIVFVCCSIKRRGASEVEPKGDEKVSLIAPVKRIDDAVNEQGTASAASSSVRPPDGVPADPFTPEPEEPDTGGNSLRVSEVPAEGAPGAEGPVTRPYKVAPGNRVTTPVKNFENLSIP